MNYWQVPADTRIRIHKRIREEKRKSMGAPIYKRKRSFDVSSDEELESANDSKMKMNILSQSKENAPLCQ